VYGRLGPTKVQHPLVIMKKGCVTKRIAPLNTVESLDHVTTTIVLDSGKHSHPHEIQKSGIEVGFEDRADLRRATWSNPLSLRQVRELWRQQSRILEIKAHATCLDVPIDTTLHIIFLRPQFPHMNLGSEYSVTMLVPDG
jgi:hypothetical protein